VKPDLSWTALDWMDDVYVLAVRLTGTDHRGDAVDKKVTLPEPCTVAEVATLVAKMNNGHYRA
jgi:hypothetical protein